MDYKGKNLRILREKKQLTQEQVAEHLGIELRTYGAYERGKMPRTDILVELADYYQVSTDYILDRTDCTSVDADYISKVVGLSDNAITLLRLENNTKHLSAYNLIDTLNTILDDSFYAEPLLKGIQDYIEPSRTIPVYYNNNAKVYNIPQLGGNVVGTEILPLPKNHKNSSGGTNYIHLASSEDAPFDNVAIPINDAFLQSVAMQQINATLHDIKDKLKKHPTD